MEILNLDILFIFNECQFLLVSCFVGNMVILMIFFTPMFREKDKSLLSNLQYKIEG